MHCSAIAQRPLFEPLRVLLEELGGNEPASLESLNAIGARMPMPPLSGAGVPIRFVAGREDGNGYEERIFRRGEVPTRPGSWHDYFNALVWLRFPHAKRALNQRHYRQLLARRSAAARERGPVRDAATHFDECGAVFAATDQSLLDALAGHRWKDLFSYRRVDFLRSARVLVFGHALYDQLREPFPGMCAKAVLMLQDTAWMRLSPEAQCERVDLELARLWAGEDRFMSARELQPLPVLGIPGVVPESIDPAYYDDTLQFRPPRRHGS
jgi:hypothetical protein